ncbi:MAG TPA: NRDE family protein [Candidatus Dormibacteraeota bacterium]|jgi:uncharacterized protein with NRDE domain|nr:NRDE family protein [Candidatus Dormibacteraeota bacterium]
MCTILIAWQCLDDADFAVAANRDELVARPTAPPGLLSATPPIYGGRDLLAGGTWLAATADGRVAAVTNRRGESQDEVGRDPSRRSRGELPVALLRSGAGDERRTMEAIRPADYNPFNLLVLSADHALVGHGAGGERVEVIELLPGPHVLCVHDIDDVAHPKELRIRERLERALGGVRSAAACVEAMTAALADHGTGGGDARDAVCIHDSTYGTVSASLVMSGAGRTLSYRHAAGRPCVTDFADVRLR